MSRPSMLSVRAPSSRGAMLVRSRSDAHTQFMTVYLIKHVALVMVLADDRSRRPRRPLIEDGLSVALRHGGGWLM